MSHPAQTDHALLISELMRSWRHDNPRLADVLLPPPLKDSGDVDILYLSPIFVFGQRSDPSSDDDVKPFTAQQVAGGRDGAGVERPGVGYIVARVGPEGAPLPSSSPGNPGLYDRQVPLEVEIFAPAISGNGLATAYGCALAKIFSGISLSPGDEWGYCIVNIDHPAGGVRFVGTDTFTSKYRWTANFIRTAKTSIAGAAPTPVMDPAGRVVLDPSGEPIAYE